MKFGLTLPNGRNSCGMSKDQLHFAKTGKHLPGIERQMALFEKNNAAFETMLDNWKQSVHTHEAGEQIVLKIRGEQDNA